MGRPITDKAGRSWALDLTIGTALRIRERTGFDLLAETNVVEPERSCWQIALPRLESSPLDLAAVLWAACEPEAAARSITRDAWLAAWNPEALERAFAVLVEETCDFFPRRSERVRAVLAAIGQIRAGLAEELVEPATPGSSSGSKPGSSE